MKFKIDVPIKDDYGIVNIRNGETTNMDEGPSDFENINILKSPPEEEISLKDNGQQAEFNPIEIIMNGNEIENLYKQLDYIDDYADQISRTEVIAGRTSNPISLKELPSNFEKS